MNCAELQPQWLDMSEVTEALLTATVAAEHDVRWQLRPSQLLERCSSCQSR